MALSLLLVVTGASRGFGRAVASAYCSSDVASQIVSFEEIRVILIARTTEGLEETKQQLLANSKEVTLDISCHTVDLCDLDQLDDNFDEIFKGVDVASFDRVMVIQNAGSVGFVGPTRDIPSLADLKKHMDMNITSTLWLSIRFLRMITNTTASSETTSSATKESSGESGGPITTIVNVSSLIAKEPFPTFGMYGCNKAARDQFFAIMAKELLSSSPSSNNDNNNIKILNYAPGPLETEMVNEIRSAETLDDGLKQFFSQTQLQPEDSARRLVKLTLENEFESGKHIDYYDLD